MVLQGNPMPLTPGRTLVPGRQVTSLTTTIVTYVLYISTRSSALPNIAHTPFGRFELMLMFVHNLWGQREGGGGHFLGTLICLWNEPRFWNRCLVY